MAVGMNGSVLLSVASFQVQRPASERVEKGSPVDRRWRKWIVVRGDRVIPIGLRNREPVGQ